MQNRDTEPLPVTAPFLSREMGKVRRLLGGVIASIILGFIALLWGLL